MNDTIKVETAGSPSDTLMEVKRNEEAHMAATGWFDPMERRIEELYKLYSEHGIQTIIQSKGKHKWEVIVFCKFSDIPKLRNLVAMDVTSDMGFEFIAVDKLRRYRPKGFIEKIFLFNKRNLFKLAK